MNSIMNHHEIDYDKNKNNNNNNGDGPGDMSTVLRVGKDQVRYLTVQSNCQLADTSIVICRWSTGITGIWSFLSFPSHQNQLLRSMYITAFESFRATKGCSFTVSTSIVSVPGTCTLPYSYLSYLT